MFTPLRLAASALAVGFAAAPAALAQLPERPSISPGARSDDRRAEDARRLEIEELIRKFQETGRNPGAPDAKPTKPQTEDAQKKEIEAALRRLLEEVRKHEAQPSTPKPPDAPKAPEGPKPPARGLPGGFGFPGGPQPGAQFQPGPPLLIEMLRGLTHGADPKTAALAKELIERLTAPAPQPGGAGGLRVEGLQFKIEPGKPDAKFGGTLELKLEPAKPAEPKAAPTKSDGGVRFLAVVEPAHTAPTLKMSADGKTAAVVGGDGSVTVFDTATGKQLMHFPTKK